MNYAAVLIPHLDGDVGDATKDDNNDDDHNDIEFLKKMKSSDLAGFSRKNNIGVCASCFFKIKKVSSRLTIIILGQSSVNVMRWHLRRGQF